MIQVKRMKKQNKTENDSSKTNKKWGVICVNCELNFFTLLIYNITIFRDYFMNGGECIEKNSGIVCYVCRTDFFLHDSMLCIISV